MTRAFDADAKAAEVGGFWPLSDATSTAEPKTLVVRAVDAATLRGVMSSYHYSGRMPDAVQECFAGYYGQTFAGGIAFGPGAGSTWRTELPNLVPSQVRELVRLWSPDGMPKNTESRLISEAFKLLKGVRLVISFSDPSAGHVGTIYQATNGIYLGMSGAGKRYETDTGERLHTRTASVYRMRHPDTYGAMTNRQVAEAEGWHEVKGDAKHRYGWAFSRQDRKTLAAQAQPYPKHL